jgi:hypothetical protein
VSAHPRRLALGIAAAACLYCADPPALAMLGFVGLLVTLVGAGIVLGRWSALWLAPVIVIGTIVGDVLWMTGWAPFDHDDVREPLPMTFISVPAIPIAMALIGIGVLAGRFSGRRGTTRTAAGDR